MAEHTAEEPIHNFSLDTANEVDWKDKPEAAVLVGYPRLRFRF